MEENKINGEYEGFIGKVVEQNDVLRITIDKRITTYLGIKASDTVKIYIKKLIKKEE